MSGAAVGPPCVVRVADVIQGPTRGVPLRLGVDGDGRLVLLVRELVQCGRLNNKPSANKALAANGKELAQLLSHAGGVLSKALWPKSSHLEGTCDVRHADVVLRWAVGSSDTTDRLRAGDREALVRDITVRARNLARMKIGALRDAMGASLGEHIELVDNARQQRRENGEAAVRTLRRECEEETRADAASTRAPATQLAGLRARLTQEARAELDEEQDRIVHPPTPHRAAKRGIGELSQSRSIIHSFAIAGECAHGCFTTRDGTSVKKVTDLVRLARKTCMYRLQGSLQGSHKQYSLELRPRPGIESLVYNLGLLQACTSYIQAFNVRSGSNFPALRIADVVEFLQHDDIVLPQDCGQQYMYLHSSAEQKLIARTRPIVLSTLRRVRAEHSRWAADHSEQTRKTDWFFKYGKNDVHYAILGLDNFDTDPRNLPDIVFNHHAQGRMCSLEIQE